ncbi:MAG: hypothetical protein J6Z11_12555 [Candidatus Riflebacteria bacterium]|nr:hypothetical protein [Candidatus Riflebacteria bacterium]
MSKVYIIQAADDNWASDLEIVAATLDKEKAKSILRKIITDYLDNAKDEGYFDENVLDDYGNEAANREDYNKFMNDFINDVVEGKTDDHYSDEFPGGNIWCIVMELQ